MPQFRMNQPFVPNANPRAYLHLQGSGEHLGRDGDGQRGRQLLQRGHRDHHPLTASFTVTVWSVNSLTLLTLPRRSLVQSSPLCICMCLVQLIRVAITMRPTLKDDPSLVQRRGGVDGRRVERNGSNKVFLELCDQSTFVELFNN